MNNAPNVLSNEVVTDPEMGNLWYRKPTRLYIWAKRGGAASVSHIKTPSFKLD